MTKEKVLDLGVGREKEYFEDDKHNIFRVGADIFFHRPESFRYFQLENRTLLDARQNLPFDSDSFDRVQMFFPDNSLLERVCNFEHIKFKTSMTIWSELRRVLSAEGVVEVFLDEEKKTPYSGDMHDENNNRRLIWKPSVRAQEAANEQGFKTRLSMLNGEEKRRLKNCTALVDEKYTNVVLLTAYA